MREEYLKPMHGITVRTYADLRSHVQSFADDKYSFLMLLGNAGVGKSETVRRLVADAKIVDTKVTAFGLYKSLYDNQDLPIVIDDVRDLYRNDDAIAVLKSLADTRLLKTVSWNTSAAGAQSGIPTSFQTTSRLCMIANEWKTLNENVRALESRATLTIEFAPSARELHDEIARNGWFTDPEVYAFIGEHLHYIVEPNFRHYISAAQLKAADQDWRSILLEWLMPNQKLKGVASLMADPAFRTDTEREAEFVKRGYGAKATFWRYKKQLAGNNGKAGTSNRGRSNGI